MIRRRTFKGGTKGQSNAKQQETRAIISVDALGSIVFRDFIDTWRVGGSNK